MKKIDSAKLNADFFEKNLSRIPVSDYDEYKQWLGAVWRFKSLGCTLEAIDQWCKGSAKYNRDSLQRAFSDDSKGRDDFEMCAKWFAKAANITLPCIGNEPLEFSKRPNETVIHGYRYRRVPGVPDTQKISLTGRVDLNKIAEVLNIAYGPRAKLAFAFGKFRKINETGDRSKDEWTLFNKEEIIKFLKVYHDGEGFESGVTFKINPFKAEIVKRENRCLDEYIKEYKYCLVESDTTSLDEQYAMVKFLKLPYVMITYSGNKSIHTLVRVDAGGSKNLYRERQKFIEDFCTANGFEIDSACKNPGRESRCPGFFRTVGEQRVLQELVASAESSEFNSYEDWEAWAKQYRTFEGTNQGKTPILEALHGDCFKDIFSDGIDYWIVYNDDRGLIKVKPQVLIAEITPYIRSEFMQMIMERYERDYVKPFDFMIPVKKFTYNITLKGDNERFYNEYECGFLKNMPRRTVTELPSEYRKLLDNIAGEREGKWLINHMSTYLHLLLDDFKDENGQDVHLETIPVLYGTQGSGKNRFMKYFGLAIAKNGYAEINKAQFESTFNVWQKNAMIFLNEFAENKQARKSTSAQLKLLTSEKQLINEKGKPQYTIEMKAYIVLAGNDSANTYGMLDIEDCDRRFMYISGGKNLNAKRHNIMDPKLFELQKEDFINYLLTYDYDLDLANTVFTNEAKLNDIEAAKQGVEQLVDLYLDAYPQQAKLMVKDIYNFGEENGFNNITTVAIGRHLSSIRKFKKSQKHIPNTKNTEWYYERPLPPNDDIDQVGIEPPEPEENRGLTISDIDQLFDGLNK